MFLMLGICLLLNGPIKIESVYSPLRQRHVSLTDQNTLFVLDASNCQVLRIAEDGSQTAFSRRGPGPGELQNPWSIEVFKDTVYVVDFLQGVEVFNIAGDFQKLVAMPDRSARPHRAVNGWVYTHDPFDRDQPSGLYWVDETGQEKETLAIYQNAERGVFFDVKENNRVHIKYNPAVDRPRMLFNAERDRMYFYQPGSSSIMVFDLNRRVLEREISLSRPKRRFDDRWGDARVAQMAANVTLNGVHVSAAVDPDFPEYFPAVTDLDWEPRGHLWVQSEASLIRADAPFQVLTRDGKPEAGTYDQAAFGRLVREGNSPVYVLAFDPTAGHALIVKTEPSNIDTVVKSYDNGSAEQEVGMDITW